MRMNFLVFPSLLLGRRDWPKRVCRSGIRLFFHVSLLSSSSLLLLLLLLLLEEVVVIILQLGGSIGDNDDGEKSDEYPISCAGRPFFKTDGVT